MDLSSKEKERERDIIVQCLQGSEAANLHLTFTEEGEFQDVTCRRVFAAIKRCHDDGGDITIERIWMSLPAEFRRLDIAFAVNCV